MWILAHSLAMLWSSFTCRGQWGVGGVQPFFLFGVLCNNIWATAVCFELTSWGGPLFLVPFKCIFFHESVIPIAWSLMFQSKYYYTIITLILYRKWTNNTCEQTRRQFLFYLGMHRFISSIFFNDCHWIIVQIRCPSPIAAAGVYLVCHMCVVLVIFSRATVAGINSLWFVEVPGGTLRA